MRQITKLFIAAFVVCSISLSFADERKEKADRVFWTHHKTLGFEDFRGDAFKDHKYNNLPDMDVLAKITKLF
jgi:hypothetical protein